MFLKLVCMPTKENKKPREFVHTLYTGVSQSGKTTLARSISRGLCLAKEKVVIFDPLGSPTAGGGWGNGAIIFDDKEAFLDLVYSEDFINAHLFIDEAHNIFAHDDKSHLWLLTEGRHFYLTLHLMTQRPKKVHPDARTNCGRCFMFRLAQDDAREIGADYGHSGINRISLDKGDFLLLNSGSAEYSRGNVFNLLEN